MKYHQKNAESFTEVKTRESTFGSSSKIFFFLFKIQPSNDPDDWLAKYINSFSPAGTFIKLTRVMFNCLGINREQCCVHGSEFENKKDKTKLEKQLNTVFVVVSRGTGLRSFGSLWAQQGYGWVHLWVCLSKWTHGGQLRTRLETGPQYL